ncbi:MAG TPA: PEP-CTERM sorting domain-containing protein [Pyrinomonadaceae bacterium]|nr:PEP-CTERM sorting domain-containing protein [Pyrinomonadaceae bacterium]
MRSFLVFFFTSLSFVLGLHTAVQAEPLVFINHPGAVATEVRGINNSGQMVGSFLDSSGRFHGFLLDRVGGTFTTIDVSGAANTLLFGINNNGQMVGTFGDSLSGITRGFLLNASGSTAIPFDVPGALATQAFGINDHGQIVGGFATPTGDQIRGFLLDGIGGNITTIDIPGAVNFTTATAINNAGQITGSFGELDLGPAGDRIISSHGFVVNSVDGPHIIIEVETSPGVFAPVTVPLGINNLGDVSGFFLSDALNQPTDHGFLRFAGTETPVLFDVPGSFSTAIAGINDLRFFVGAFNNSTIGFVSESIPEPSSLMLIGTGFLSLFGYVRRLKRKKS